MRVEFRTPELFYNRCDSDSDSDYYDLRVPRYGSDNDLPSFLLDETLEKWSLIPTNTKKDALQRLKICSFWFPLLLQRDEYSEVAHWAVRNGLISPESEDLTPKNLRMIQVVECLLRTLERASMNKDLTRALILHCKSPMDCLEDFLDVLHYVKRIEEAEKDVEVAENFVRLCPYPACCNVLNLLLAEFAKFIHEMGTNLQRTLWTLERRVPESQIQRSEAMKRIGNESFQKKKYDEAVRFYSEAIKFFPDNHILYGNRSLCYIRSGKFIKAARDGRCATLIDPLWAKGHYRYCEALFSLGETSMATKANELARSLCKDDVEGMKDLNQQNIKFCIDTETTGYSWMSNGAAYGGFYQQNFAKPSGTSPNRSKSSKKVSEVKGDKRPAKPGSAAQKENKSKEAKPAKSEFPSSKSAKAESNNATKKKAKREKKPVEEEKKEAEGKAGACKELRSFVQDAHVALGDLRSHNAEQAFNQALTLLESSTPKELGLSTLDVLLLMFGRASALTEIGQLQELSEAQKVLKKMRSYEERTFQCLVYYAIGRVYLRENRFSAAMEQFSNSLQMVKNQITPGKLTWPLTREVVKETQPDYLKEVLESAIELCRFPPPPDAVCRLEKCICSVKAEIYFTDPDFKGFIRMCCCQSCTVEYHMTCWKSLKTSVYNEKNEKDFLQEPCLTPDCVGLICSIRIYGPTGLVKCKFEAAIQKLPTSKKPKVNQKCTSLKKLKSKEEHKAKRKQHKQSFQEKQVLNEEILQQTDDAASQSQPKAWLLYRDRVLLQINQNVELLREEKGLPVSALTRSLKPWLELDASRGNQLATRMLIRPREEPLTLGGAVELLLERKNRVWARILIQQLSSCTEVKPKLHNWARHLNDAGLDAARAFIERHSEHLEQLDLALLLQFDPLQDMILEKLGTRPEFFSAIGLTVTEYLKQAPPQDMRLFIWTLEEHRDDFVSCHTLLDEYFDMMDGNCSVLKKSDENENNSPMRTKNRGRKKKRNYPKDSIVLSGMRGVTSREEWNQDFFEDDSLAFLHPADSFGVPSHLRDEVATFEEQYSRTRHRTPFQNILDNNPDPTKESLYDYFAQILEEHGPLMADDPLLTSQLEDFPDVALESIRESGDFEAFLLGSLRFIKIGQRVGLAKHAVELRQLEPGARLDDLDEFAELNQGAPYPQFEMEPDFTNGGVFYAPPQPDGYTILPNPYATEFVPAAAKAVPQWSNGEEAQTGYCGSYEYAELDLYRSEFLGETWDEVSPDESVAPATPEDKPSKVDAAVQTQTCEEAMRSVSVNTEIHTQFESCQGDINRKEKSNMRLEKDIQKMTEELDRANVTKPGNVTKPADVVSLEGEIQQIDANIQVTNQELLLFQQKLEEEVKKDQKEKKAHQEALKTLKQETEGLVEEQGSLSRSIREKKVGYDDKLRDFLDLSNQSATEKMSLEDEIKRCRALLSSSTQRSLTTQLLMAESSRDQVLYGARRELADAKALLSKADEALVRFPNQQLEQFRIGCSAAVEELEKKISTTEQQYQEQISRVKSGQRMNELPPANLPNRPEPAAAAAVLSAASVHRPAQASRSTPPPPVAEAAAAAAPAVAPAHKQPTRSMHSPSHGTKFERTMESLTGMFPDLSRPEIMRFVQEQRASSGGSLSSMSLQELVSGVAQLILDHQERLSAVRSSIAGRGSPSQSRTPPPSVPVWQPVSNQKAAGAKALNMEDPCIICHEDMDPADACVLECRHSFHGECIRSWLREQSTCPTCRTHALLPEDFPVLPGRRRQAP